MNTRTGLPDPALKTPWYPRYINPEYVGVYEAQTKSIRCNCCWVNAFYEDGKWWKFAARSNLLTREEVLVVRWRGSTVKLD